MAVNSLAISYKLALGELRQGWRHFAVFLACLILGVAVMASVNSFGAIIKNSFKTEAQSLLGGDIEIRIRGMAATDEQRQFITKYGDVSYVANLRSMLHFQDEHTLVEVKAVDSNYPLLGKLQFNENIKREAVFKKNGIAIDSILLSQMGLALGDEVTIGAGTYTIRATLKTEPDRSVQIFTFGPRIMMNHAALAESQLVNTFSLVEHRYRVVVPKNVTADETYKAAIRNELGSQFPNVSWRISLGTDANSMIKRFLTQLLSFMTLSSLATFLIAGIGIGSSVRSYLQKKSQTIAVLKVQGASRKIVFTTYAFVIAILVVVGGAIGSAISMAITTAFMPMAGEILPSIKGQGGIHWPSLLLAVWYGFLVAFLFSIPALFSAVNIRPSLLFRSKTGVLLFRNDNLVRAIIAVFSLLLVATLLLNSDDKVFIGGAIFVIFLSFSLFYLCGVWVKFATKRIRVKTVWLKLALGNIYRPGSTSGTVIYAIGISLTVLIALTLTEANFQNRIKQLMEEKAPSLFMIDIQPYQKEALNKLLLEYAHEDQIMLYPMSRGRIIKIDGKPVREVDVSDDVDWAVRGDRGLSYSVAPPENANIIEGEWWPEDYQGKPLLSVDSRFLEGMGIEIGDTITVSILGEEITAEITSAREIDYSTFQLNFAMILSPGVIEKFPHTSLATIHLEANEDTELELASHIAKEFPGVTAIRTKEVVELVQTIMGHIATALKVTVGISLFAGLLVLTSALSATIEQRMYDVAVLKVLGARRSDILKSCTAEWMILALTTSVIASVIGTVSAYFINSRLRSKEFLIMPEVTLTTIALCIIVIWLIGYLGNRRLFNFRVAGLLRNE
jgi:putative ABC transport system permease protein